MTTSAFNIELDFLCQLSPRHLPVDLCCVCRCERHMAMFVCVHVCADRRLMYFPQLLSTLCDEPECLSLNLELSDVVRLTAQ